MSKILFINNKGAASHKFLTWNNVFKTIIVSDRLEKLWIIINSHTSVPGVNGKEICFFHLPPHTHTHKHHTTASWPHMFYAPPPGASAILYSATHFKQQINCKWRAYWEGGKIQINSWTKVRSQFTENKKSTLNILACKFQIFKNMYK